MVPVVRDVEHVDGDGGDDAWGVGLDGASQDVGVHHPHRRDDHYLEDHLAAEDPLVEVGVGGGSCYYQGVANGVGVASSALSSRGSAGSLLVPPRTRWSRARGRPASGGRTSRFNS